MGFLWAGSTGARAVQMLRGKPPGTIIETPDFALLLDANPVALHQLLANAVQLRLIKKLRTRGRPCIGWTLGAGNVNATIELHRPPRPAPSPEQLERRRAAAEQRQQRLELQATHPPFAFTSSWPPGFVSQLAAPARPARDGRELDDSEPERRKTTAVADERTPEIAPEVSSLLDALLRELARPACTEPRIARCQRIQEPS